MDGHCLLFEELTIEIGVDTKYLQQINCGAPSQIYSLSRCLLPSSDITPPSELVISKALEHAEKLGKIKAIYNYENHQYIIEFGGLKEQ